MKRNILTSKISLAAIAVAGFLGAACSSSDEPKAATRLILDADKTGSYDNVNLTRSLSESGSGISFTWETADKAYVYTTGWGTKLGELSPLSDQAGSTKTKLDGEVSSAGVKVSDWLMLITPRTEWDYTGQDGTLATISSKYDYATASASVTNISGGKIYASNASFKSEQAIVKFVLTDNGGTALNVQSLSISAISNKLVQKKTLDGASAEYGDLTITPAAATNEFYVALRNDSEGADTYTLKATVDTNIYNYTKQDVTFEKGKFKTVNVRMKFIDDTYTERDGYSDAGTETWN